MLVQREASADPSFWVGVLVLSSCALFFWLFSGLPSFSASRSYLLLSRELSTEWLVNFVILKSEFPSNFPTEHVQCVIEAPCHEHTYTHIDYGMKFGPRPFLQFWLKRELARSLIHKYLCSTHKIPLSGGAVWKCYAVLSPVPLIMFWMLGREMGSAHTKSHHHGNTQIKCSLCSHFSVVKGQATHDPVNHYSVAEDMEQDADGSLLILLTGNAVIHILSLCEC